MNFRRIAATAGMIVICGALCYRAGSAAPADDKAQKEPLTVRYARAQLKLAELTLLKVQELNKRVPLTIPNPMVAQFTDDVEFAKAQLESAIKTNGVDAFQGWIERSEVAVRTAEGKLKQAQESDRAVPGTYKQIDMDRFRLGVELAKLQLERGRSLAKAAPEAKLQWQLELLADGMARLKEQTWLISQNRGPLEF